MMTKIRYPQLDGIRGLALWGIFIVNIVWFSIPPERFGELYGGGPYWYNDFINFLRVELFGGRTATVFAFLFGLGMSMQWNRWHSTSMLIKRNLVLAMFGVLHIVLLLGGDILLDYAVFGLLGVALVRLPKKVLLAITIVIALWPSLLMVLRHYEIMAPAGAGASLDYSLEDKIELFRNGSFVDQCMYRIKQYTVIWRNPWVLNFYFPPVLACFVLGLLAAKTNFLSSFDQTNKYARLLVAFVVLKAFLTFLNHSSMELMTSWKSLLVFQVIFQWDQYFTSFILVAVVLVSINSAIKMIWRPFEILGRMSLTTYILQSVLSSILFYSFGFAQFDSLSPLQVQIFCLIFIVVICGFNYFWLKKYRRGPLEHIWRKLSYPEKMN